MVSSFKLRVIVSAAVLLVSVLVSVLVIWFASDIGPSMSEPTDSLPRQTKPFGKIEALSLLPTSSKEGAFLTKPLFLAERDATQRPLEPVKVPETQEEKLLPLQVRPLEPLDLKVVGMINDNGKFIGLFLPPSGGDMVRLATGEQYREWTLESFENDSVNFVLGERSERLYINE